MRKNTTTKKWYIKFPLDAYAMGPIEAKNEKEIRQEAREIDGCKRLPKGFACWKTN